MESIDEKYVQLTRAGLPDDLCLTWCHEDNMEEVARKFGADMETGIWASVDEIEELEEEDDLGVLIELDSLGEWVVAFEPNGNEGARETVMESISTDGRAFSIFWNVELDSSILYAVGGRIITSFTLLGIEQRSGSDPTALNDMLAELGLHNGLSTPARKARLLALGEMISGQPITPEWLRSPKLTFQINDPIQDPLVPREYLNPRASFLDDPEFTRILAGPSADMAPAVTKMIASIVVSATIPENLLAKNALRVLNLGERLQGERERLQEQLFEQASNESRKANSLHSETTPHAEEEEEEAKKARRSAHVLSILARALNPHPVNAAYGAAVEAASLPLPSKADAMRLKVLWNVARHIEGSIYRSEP
ncbi:DUF6461 domain-containing protein [Streptosporangium canum]|uniref:DUF6461 domain-containing protein n=1 Tax=Streptosporangium canum TaxID=324952 RepID=UPI0033A0846E